MGFPIQHAYLLSADLSSTDSSDLSHPSLLIHCLKNSHWCWIDDVKCQLSSYFTDNNNLIMAQHLPSLLHHGSKTKKIVHPAWQNSLIHQIDLAGLHSMLVTPCATSIANGSYLFGLSFAHCNAVTVAWSSQICQTLGNRGWCGHWLQSQPSTS